MRQKENQRFDLIVVGNQVISAKTSFWYKRLFLCEKVNMMRRFVYWTPRLPYRVSPGQRLLATTTTRAVDKKQVDELLNPLSQKYADAKDEVSSLRST